MPKPPLAPIFVTLGDAVRLSGVSRSRLYEWKNSGRLSVRYNGSRPLFVLAEVLAEVDSLSRGFKPTGPMLQPEDREAAREQAGEPDFVSLFAQHLERLNSSLGEPEARTRALASVIRAYRRYHECDFKAARIAVMALLEPAP